MLFSQSNNLQSEIVNSEGSQQCQLQHTKVQQVIDHPKAWLRCTYFSNAIYMYLEVCSISQRVVFVYFN